MSTFKCKMCGGNLEIIDNSTVCECEYCGTQQTIPTVRDDVTANLFNRANNLRMKSEFDKAQEIYEKIVANNENESEAYWGIVLCKFGIEYVEDPATFKKIPTCHRTQLESVLTDVDYLAAIEHADLMQKSVYETEAKAIDKLQRDILDIVHKEEPFDVFICYKETDENGKRTQDSVIANDIYHQLTQEGFKVFYAAITLEDKLGQEYEPYIFAALNSAKVMLAIGTKPEYFSAVWVKNEWSRYLKLMKADRSKMLFPCYKDMDAYDLPEEFSHLQAQDMSKIGFINDLVRGIKKVVVKDEPKAASTERVVEKVAESANSNTAPLLKRAFMFLEDGEWNSANDYAEKVLDIDPECSDAYIVKLYAEFEVNNHEDFRRTEKDVEDIKSSNNFKKAYKFGKQAELDDDIKEILYNKAVRAEDHASSENEYYNASERFRKIFDYKDSASRAEKCVENAKKSAYQLAEKTFNTANDETSYKKAAELYNHVLGYKDADEKVEKSIEAGKECAYQAAESAFKKADNENSFKAAADLYRHISGYKDADEKVEKSIEAAMECAYRLAEKAFDTANDEISYKKAAKLYNHVSGYKDADEKSAECVKLGIYKAGLSIMKSAKNEDNYLKAIEMFKRVLDYKDAEEKYEACIKYIYDKALQHRNNFDDEGIWEKSKALLMLLKNYKNTDAEVAEIDTKIRAFNEYNKEYSYLKEEELVKNNIHTVQQQISAKDIVAAVGLIFGGIGLFALCLVIVGLFDIRTLLAAFISCFLIVPGVWTLVKYKKNINTRDYYLSKLKKIEEAPSFEEYYNKKYLQ